MNLHALRVIGMPVLLASVCLLCFAFGCNKAPSRNTLQAFTTAQSTTAGRPANSDDPGINLQCSADRLRKAPAPFHWSFKKVVTPDTNADWEADVTADTIGGTITDASGARAIHGSRSDATSWNTAVLILAAPLPTSTFALVDNSSATKPAGLEKVNAINAIRYLIDTSQDTSAEAALIQSVLGPKGFVKGTAWVTREGCPVKFSLSVEQHNHDGTTQKEDYELNLSMQ